jgi:hypothetical protein
MSAKDQLAAATTADGILAINPGGDLVRLRPGSVKLAADVERGTYLTGLKDGWKLAAPADVKAKQAAAADGEKKSPRGKPSPKKSGA